MSIELFNQVKIAIFICEKFSPFMHRMQSASPLIGNLYGESAQLLHSVLACFVKPASLPDLSDGDSLIKLDPRDNRLDLPMMSPSAKACFDLLSEEKRTSAKRDVISMYSKMARYLQDNLHPLQSTLVKSLRVLNPKIQKDISDRGKSEIVSAAKEFDRFSTTEIDALALQWDDMILSNFVIKDGERLDSFYVRVLEGLKKTEEQPFPKLTLFLRIALSLPTSNSGTTIPSSFHAVPYWLSKMSTPRHGGLSTKLGTACN